MRHFQMVVAVVTVALVGCGPEDGDGGTEGIYCNSFGHVVCADGNYPYCEGQRGECRCLNCDTEDYEGDRPSTDCGRQLLRNCPYCDGDTPTCFDGGEPTCGTDNPPEVECINVTAVSGGSPRCTTGFVSSCDTITACFDGMPECIGPGNDEEARCVPDVRGRALGNDLCPRR